MSVHPYARLFFGLSAPTIDEDSGAGYEVGDEWIIPGTASYKAIDVSPGAAVWENITAGGGSPNWGDILGSLGDQADLQSALDSLVTAAQIVGATQEDNINGADLFGYRQTSGAVLKKTSWGNILNLFIDEFYSLLHNHDGADTVQLVQANTHQSPDTDSAASSLHHTIGAGANQAAAGNHNHEVDQRADIFLDAEGDPADPASAAADGTSTYGARRDHVHKGPSKAIMIYQTNGLSGSIPAASTNYLCPFIDGTPSATERVAVITRAATVKNFYVRQVGAQPGTGSLQCYVRENATTDEILITIAAGAAGPATRSNTSTAFTVAAGDFIGFKFVNNAPAAPSATIGFVAVEVEFDP